MYTAPDIKALLFNDISVLASNPVLYAKDPCRDFSRNRKINAETLMRFMIMMQRDSMPRELLSFFTEGGDIPSDSAFYQQRSKLLPSTFQQLFHTFNSHFKPSLYKGKYVLTDVDGSTFNIFRRPCDDGTYHPPDASSPLGFNSIHAIASYNILDRTFQDCVIQPGMLKNEYAAICSLIDNSSTAHGIPLFIADRGFPSYNMFAHAEKKGICYMVRAKDNYVERLLKDDALLAMDEFDAVVERIITRTNAKKYRSQPGRPELYRYIDRNTSFDFLEPGKPGEFPLTIRVVRVKITEDSYINLITNLPSEEFPKEDLKELYHFRWNEETAFRELKYAVGAADFHSKSLEYIVHEVWSRLILHNLCSWITALAVKYIPKNRKHPYQINYTTAIAIIHRFLRQGANAPPCDVVALIGRYVLPVRAGRNYPRYKKFRIPMKFVYRH